VGQRGAVLPGPALPRATGVCGQSRGTPSTTIPTRGPKVGGYAKVASYFVTDKFKQSGLGPVADGMSKAWHTLVGCCGGWSQTFGKRPLGWTLVVMERKKKFSEPKNNAIVWAFENEIRNENN